MAEGTPGPLSAGAVAAPEGFRSASSLLPPPVPTAPSSRPAPAVGSLRNASTSTEDPSKGDEGAGPSESTAGADGAVAAQVKPTGPVKPVNRSASAKRAIIYSSVQRKNPVLSALQGTLKSTTEIGDIPADYQVGQHAGVLFLSLKYHRLHPEYIHQRIEKIRNVYKSRILLVLCDVSEHQLSLRELAKISIINELTLIVAWTNDEVAQYLSTFKAYEHKSSDTLKERVHQQYKEQLEHVLTSGKRVNRTDANNLASQFGSFEHIARQQAKALAGVKGLGTSKVTSLVDAFHKPFLVGGLKRKQTAPGEEEEVDPISNLVRGRAIAAVPETGATTAPSRTSDLSRKGKGRDSGARDALNAEPGQGTGGEVGEEGKQDEDEDIGSPDWPESDDDDDGDDLRPISRQRERVESRSPGPGPGVPDQEDT